MFCMLPEMKTEKIKNENQIVAVGRGKYERLLNRQRRNRMSTPHSIEYKDIESKIMGAYPLVDFRCGELIQYSGKPTGRCSSRLKMG